MKHAVVVAAAAAAMMTFAMSCFIDRHSTEFECDGNSDCAAIEGGLRECKEGYCVLASCPSACNGGCSTTAKSCSISCSNTSDCSGGVRCPTGYTCTFACSQDCLDLECPLGCTVLCSGNTECGPIDCGSGATCSCSASGNATCL